MKVIRHLHIACALALVLLLLPGAAVAGPPAQEIPGGAMGILTPLFPTLARLPAPAWLKEGVRVTYASASATTSNSADGTGGAGLIQYDIVATERRTVAAYVSFYLDLGNGDVQQNFSTASVTGAGVGDFWINPDVLKNAEDVAGDGLSVTRMPYNAAGADFNAVRFQYEGDTATYVYMFDEVSGLLLFYRHDVPVNTESHQLAQMTLAGVRTLKLPWKAGGPALALNQGDSADYAGQFSTLIAGGPVTPLPIGSHVEVTKLRPRWMLTSNTGTLNGQSSGSTTGLTGATQLFGGVWLPGGGVPARPRRAIIDTDPLTGATVSFTRTDNGLIVITENGASYATSLYYDGETGFFVGLHKVVQVGVATNTYDLEIVQ